IRPGYLPGQYPSAGPLPHLIDVWRAGAPALGFLAPDIHFPEVAHRAGLRTRRGHPLVVPEALRSTDAAANALDAFGAHGALGFSPFGIESIEAPAAAALRAAYDVVTRLTPLIVDHLGDGSMTALLPPSDEQREPHRVIL